MSAWELRTPTKADLPALCELGRRSFTETFGHLYAPGDLAAFLEQTFGPGGLPLEFANPAYSFRVAEAESALVGFCKVGPPYLPAPGDGRSKD